MFRSVASKTLYNLRFQLLGWFVSVTAVAALTMALYNSLSQTGIEGIVNSVPDSLKSLIGSVADFTTVAGYIGQQIFGPNIVLLTIIMAVLVCLGVSASEEDDGRLQSLLSLPVSRSKVYFQKWIVLVMFIGVVCLGIAFGIAFGLVVVDKSADWSRITESLLSCWLMNVAYGMVAYAAAMLSGRKSLAIAFAAGYAAASFVISSLATSVKSLSFVDKFSIFHYYNTPQIMQNGLSLRHLAVLVAVILGLTLIGWIGFMRRDIQT